MKIEMTIGDRLQLIRKKRGLTLDDLQKSIGINRTQMNAYENDKRTPGSKTLKKLSDFFTVPIDYLVSGEEKQGANQHEDFCRDLLNKLKELDPDKQKDLIETFTLLVDKALEKRASQKKGNHAVAG